MVGFLVFSTEYVFWHYSQGVRDVMSAWRNVLWFVSNYFSIGLLAKSLFSPWRSLGETKKKSGFDPAEFFGNLVVNTIMRLVGFLIRIVFILVGSALALFLMILMPFLIAFWLLIPFLILGSLVFGFYFLLF